MQEINDLWLSFRNFRKYLKYGKKNRFQFISLNILLDNEIKKVKIIKMTLITPPPAPAIHRAQLNYIQQISV